MAFPPNPWQVGAVVLALSGSSYAAGGVGALASSARRTVLALCLAVYAYFFVDGAERRVAAGKGSRMWPWFAQACGPLLMRTGLLPRLRLRFVWEDEASEQVLQARAAQVPLDPVTSKPLASSRYIFGSHPHGVLSLHHGMYCVGASEPSFLTHVSPVQTRRDLSADVFFRLPLLRDFGLFTGMVSADKKTARKALDEQLSLMILVGGEAEQVLARRGKDVVFIRERKGFCRLALEYGVPVVPIFVFGESDLCSVLREPSWFAGLRWWVMKKLRVAITLPCWYHVSTELTACFGRPIYPAMGSKPASQTDRDVDQAAVDDLHARYIAELQRVYEFYRTKLPGYADRVLEVR